VSEPAVVQEFPWGRGVLPNLTCQIADLGTGFFMRSGPPGDCLRASVATLLQIPYEQVPGPMMLEGELEEFAEELGLHLHVVEHGQAPTGHWIGHTCGLDGAGPGGDEHTVVCRGESVVFDPDGWVYAGGLRGPQVTGGIAGGWQFQSREETP
jgi:hypothetical protein